MGGIPIYGDMLNIAKYVNFVCMHGCVLYNYVECRMWSRVSGGRGPGNFDW